jgi:aminotransferase
MHNFADRINAVGESKIAESLKILEQDPSIISLGAGEPDFPTPNHIITAAYKMLKKGYTHYSPLQGKKELREAIAKKVKKDNKIDATSEEVIVTCGSKEAILLAMMTFVDPGDEVIVPDPSYVAYIPIVKLINGIPVSLPLREENNFEVDADVLEKLVTKKTKIVVINSPANPTGTVYSRKTLEEIADVAIDKNLMIVSDEAYEKLVYDDAKHISIGSLNGMKEHTITLQTFSKTYAMCGFRIGYAVAPKDVIKEMTEFKICTTLGAPTAFQMAAVAALTGPQACVEKMRKEYDRRRKFIVKRLNEIGLSCIKPKGAFYAFPNISSKGMSSEQFSDFLLKKAKVLVVPGTEFGKYGEGYVRMSYATAYEKIEEALNRIEKVVKNF